jgi:hypothetical protein
MYKKGDKVIVISDGIFKGRIGILIHDIKVYDITVRFDYDDINGWYGFHIDDVELYVVWNRNRILEEIGI